MAICTFQRNDAHHWVWFWADYLSVSYYTYLKGGHKPVFFTDMTQPSHTVLIASETIKLLITLHWVGFPLVYRASHEISLLKPAAKIVALGATRQLIAKINKKNLAKYGITKKNHKLSFFDWFNLFYTQFANVRLFSNIAIVSNIWFASVFQLSFCFFWCEISWDTLHVTSNKQVIQVIFSPSKK